MDRYVLLPLLTPAVLLAARRDTFGFDPPALLDAFMYVGYFWHYPEHLWVFDDNSNYKISRLPWILPGFIAHTLIGPVVASYLLAYLTLAGGAVAIYLLVRDGLDDRAAAATAGVAWACCTWVHGIGGWNYHVLAAAAYYLAACWLAVRAARSPSSRLPALLAGALFAAAVHTHLLLAAFAPLLAWFFSAALPRGERRLGRTLRAAVAALGGGVVLTALLAIVNRATGGAWLFFVPQIEQAMKLTQPAYDHWWRANASTWLPSALYLVIPLAFAFAGVAMLWRHRLEGDRRRLAFAFVGSAWAALAIMCFFQFVRRQTTLDYPYMAFALYLHAFPCLAAALSAWKPSQRHSHVVVGLVTAIMLGPLLFLLPTPVPGTMDAMSAWIGLGARPPIVAPLVVSLAGVAAMQLVRGSARLVVFALWFSVVNAWIAPAPAAYGMATPGYRHSMLTLFREADRFTTELDSTLVGIKYWMSDEPIAAADRVVRSREVFDSFVATRAWFTNLLGRDRPSPPIERLTIADLERGTCIGVLSSTGSQAILRQQMESHFARLGRPLRQVAARRFERPNFAFALTVLRPVSPDTSGDAGPPCEGHRR